MMEISAKNEVDADALEELGKVNEQLKGVGIPETLAASICFRESFTEWN